VDKKSYICLKTVGKRCPICEERDELYKQGADKPLIKALHAQKKQLCNIIDLNDAAKGIQLWDEAYSNFGEMLEQKELPRKPKYSGYFLPDCGFSLEITFSQEKFEKNDYLTSYRIDFLEREPYDDSIVDKTIDLDKVFNILSYDELKKALYGLDDEPEKQEAPSPTQSRRSIVEEEESSVPRKRPAPMQVESPEEVEEASSQRQAPSRRRREETPSIEKNLCPFNHKYGMDIDNQDNFEDCDKCGDEWEGCREKKDIADKANRKK
jgi:hypothetical protein